MAEPGLVMGYEADGDGGAGTWTVTYQHDVIDVTLTLQVSPHMLVGLSGEGMEESCRHFRAGCGCNAVVST